MQKSLLTLFSFVFTISIYATDYEIGTGGTTSSSPNMPIAFASMTYNSISQQLYFASELTEAGASEGTITAISFYYMSSTAKTRTCEVWISEVTKTYLASSVGDDQWMYGISSGNPAPGTKVFDGIVSIPAASGWYTITLDSEFSWGGTKNLVITINDKTDTRSSTSALNHKIYTTSKSTKPCGIYNIGASGSSFNAANAYNLTGTAIASTPVIKISFADAPSIPVPTSPSASSITRHAATLGWTAAEGADSYEVRYGTTSGSIGDATNVGNVTSYEISGLEESTTYYYQIRTKIGDAYSAWTTEASFTTLNHTHNAITFTKWTYSGTLPTSAGNYYLAHDVTLSTDWDPAGSINLCLNGKTVNLGSDYGIINGGITVAIYDEEGGGKITSSNSNQTLLASGNLTNLFIYAEIENIGSGRKVKAASGATASIDDPIDLSDADDNASIIAENEDLLVNISMTRSFTRAQYNTICLPFGLKNAQLQYIFGEGYDLEELTGSSLDGDLLNLEFTSRTTLTAGKPYLLKPSVNVTNPSFEGVTISATSPVDQTSDTYISFHGTYAPTELTGGNRNLLFLGADNELLWPATTANIKGFRAYFEVKGGAQGAKRARIVKKEDAATGMDQITNDKLPMTNKILRNGQLLILRDNKTYNVLGMEYK